MSSFSLFGTTCAAAALFVSVASAATLEDHTSFFVFGDSLSDPGNLFAATGGTTPVSPPYFQGRFSNGPVWAEGLTAQFASNGLLGANFAFGGARAVTNADPIPDLSLQLGIFASGVPSVALGAKPLASLWFGANDLFGAVEQFSDGLASTADVKAVGRAAAAAVAAGAKSLLLAGIKDVVIFNLPDLGSLPAYALFEPGSVDTATKGSRAFNRELNTQINGLRTLGMNVTEINAKGLFDTLLADPSLFGVSNATLPCLIPGFSLCTPAQAEQLAFFDPVHPTTQIHAAISGEVRAALAPVPLPMPAALLGTALFGLFGLTRARRVAKTALPV